MGLNNQLAADEKFSRERIRRFVYFLTLKVDNVASLYKVWLQRFAIDIGPNRPLALALWRRHFYYYYQNPSGFCFLAQIIAFFS